MAYFFDTKDSISIIGFLATFNLACNTNLVHKGAEMWVLPHYLNETLANAFNSHMCTDDKSTPITASFRSNGVISRELLRSFTEEVIYLFKKFTKNYAISEFDLATLCYMQPSNMTTMTSRTTLTRAKFSIENPAIAATVQIE